MATITGTTGNDSLVGTAAADIINGLAGDDIIDGGDADDVLDGGAGADTLTGGNGTDTATYASATSAVTLNLKTGVNTGDALGDTYIGIEKYIGSGYADTFVSGSVADNFNGGNGVDTINYSTSAAAVSVNLTLGTGAGGDADGDVLSSIEKVIGSTYADTLASSTSGHALLGGAGDDLYVIGASSGVVVTENVGEGIDEVQTALSNLSISSYANVENLTYTGSVNFNGQGNASDNILTGGAGADTLYGFGGADTLNGGDGNDILVGGAGSDILNGSNGIDTASYSGASSSVTLNFLTGVHIGDAAGDVFNSIEKYIGSGYNDTFVAGAGADIIEGASGTDTIDYSASTSAVSINLTTGVVSGGNAVGDVLTSIESVIGTAFVDTLASSTSGHILLGGAGDDIYVVGNSGVIATESAGEGVDEVRTALNGLSIANYANVENLVYTGTAAFVGTGNDIANIITGGIGADYLFGGGGDDTLEGGDGNDVLVGGAGADILNGGNGANTASYQTSAASMNFNFRTGVIDGDAVGDIFNNITRFIGTGYDDYFIAGSGVDYLDGSGGRDTISYEFSPSGVNLQGVPSGGDAAGDTLNGFEIFIGSAYADTLVGAITGWSLQGGAGDDVYIISNAGATAVEAVGGGIDEVRTSLATLSIGLYFNVENLIYTGTAAFNGSGNVGDNVITGGVGNDTLNGMDGNDTLNGGDGNDTLIDRLGADIFNGGNGTDTVLYQGGAVTIDLKTGVHGGEAANDTFISIEKYTGSGWADTFVSGSGADNLNGGSGIDTINYASSAAAVTVDLTAGTASGGDAAGDVLAAFEKVVGSAFADTLASSTSGHTLLGGAGDDIYLVGSAGVVATETAGEGTDEVRTALAVLSIANYANVENLVYTGSAAFTGTGNSIANVITGGIGADTLTGGGGDDTLNGGDGNDFLDGGAGIDILNGGNGIDTASYASSAAAVTIDLKTGILSGDAAGDILSSVERYSGSTFDDTFISGAGADNLAGAGGIDTISYASSAAAVTVDLTAGTGSGGDAAGDVLASFEKVVGSAYADTLTSSTSGHTLLGGAGDDIYIVGNAGVVATENSGEGTDEVRTALASLSIANYANVENLVYTSTAAFTGTGNDIGNIITGGVAADTLYGKGGVDTLNGGDGNDALVGGAGADVLNGGNGTDIASYIDSLAGIVIDASGASSTGDAVGDTFNSIEGIRGTEFNDTFVARAGSLSFNGGAGIDTVSYAASTAGIALNVVTGVGSGDAAGDIYSAVEVFVGTAFADAITGSSANETFIGGAGADTIDGSGGTDTASFADSTAGVSLNIATGVGSGDASGDIYTNVEIFVGSAFDDTFIGGTTSETFIGGDGADTIDGGGGSDTISYVASGSAVTANLATGSFSGGTAAGDIVTNVENLLGSEFSDTLTGDALANAIHGGAGNDIIYGGGGDDVITGETTYNLASVDEAHGGDGNDNIDFANTGTGIIFGDAGNDTLRSGRTAASETHGGDGNDVITIFNGKGYGDAGSDVLTSYENGAEIYGGDGDDVLKVNFNGYMFGGEGSDEYSLDLLSTAIAYIKDDGLSGTDTVFTNWTAAQAAAATRTRVGDDLRISQGGDIIVLQSWYNGYHTIEHFVSTDHQFIFLGI